MLTVRITVKKLFKKFGAFISQHGNRNDGYAIVYGAFIFGVVFAQAVYPHFFEIGAFAAPLPAASAIVRSATSLCCCRHICENAGTNTAPATFISHIFLCQTLLVNDVAVDTTTSTG